MEPLTMTAEFAFIAGIFATVLHVLTGPDHLAAITPLIVESKNKAWRIGLSWGIGHITGMAIIGLLFVGFKDLIPLEQISNFSEQLVGAVLIGIGIWAFYKVFNGKKNHNHLHASTRKQSTINSLNPVNTKSDLTSFYIGVLHGFAGIAHYLLFLPVLGFAKQWDSIAYVIGSCIGIIIAMTAFAFVVGKVASLTKNEDNPVFFRGIRLAGGLFAILIGVYWMLFN